MPFLQSIYFEKSLPYAWLTVHRMNNEHILRFTGAAECEGDQSLRGVSLETDKTEEVANTLRELGRH